RSLIERLVSDIRRTVRVVGFIEYVPRDYAPVFREASDDSLHVATQLFEARCVREDRSAGALYPAGVMHMRDRCALRAEVRHRIPNRVEEHEHRPNMVTVGDREELVHATQKTDRVLLPEEM